jgi:hypothetical protein
MLGPAFVVASLLNVDLLMVCLKERVKEGAMGVARVAAALGVLACILSATEAVAELQRRSTAPLNDTD